MAERKSKQIGALWLKTDGKVQYMSGVLDLGTLGEVHIAVFKNTRKEKDSQPDYNIVTYIEPRQSAPPQRQPGDEEHDNIPF